MLWHSFSGLKTKKHEFASQEQLNAWLASLENEGYFVQRTGKGRPTCMLCVLYVKLFASNACYDVDVGVPFSDNTHGCACRVARFSSSEKKRNSNNCAKKCCARVLIERRSDGVLVVTHMRNHCGHDGKVYKDKRAGLYSRVEELLAFASLSDVIAEVGTTAAIKECIRRKYHKQYVLIFGCG